MSTKRLVSREPDQMREVTMQRNVNKHAEGSVLVGFGDTKVICTASNLVFPPFFEAVDRAGSHLNMGCYRGPQIQGWAERRPKVSKVAGP